jgi:hypothetical protein
VVVLMVTDYSVLILMREHESTHDIDRSQDLVLVETPALIRDARKILEHAFQFSASLILTVLLSRIGRLIIARTCSAAVDHGNHECRRPS